MAQAELKENAKLLELEQECYSLQKKLEGHQNMQATYQDELDSLQAESAACEKRLRDSHAKELRDLHNQITTFKADLEKARGRETEVDEMKKQILLLQKQNNSLQQQHTPLSPPINNNDRSPSQADPAILQTLMEEKSKLLAERDDWKERHEGGVEEGRRLKVELNNKDEEMQHLKKAFDALDKEKHKQQVELRVLKAQLDASKAKPDHLQGNSLFSEVEDRRVEVEKRMMELRLENDSVKKRLQLNQQLLSDAKLLGTSQWDKKSADEYRARVAELEMEVVRMDRAVMSQNLTFNQRQDQMDLLLKRLQDETLKADPQQTYAVHYAMHNESMGLLREQLEEQRQERYSSERSQSALKSQLFNLHQEVLVLKNSEAKLKLRLKETGALEKENREGRSTKPERLPFNKLSLNLPES